MMADFGPAIKALLDGGQSGKLATLGSSGYLCFSFPSSGLGTPVLEALLPCMRSRASRIWGPKLELGNEKHRDTYRLDDPEPPSPPAFPEESRKGEPMNKRTCSVSSRAPYGASATWRFLGPKLQLGAPYPRSSASLTACPLPIRDCSNPLRCTAFRCTALGPILRCRPSSARASATKTLQTRSVDRTRLGHSRRTHGAIVSGRPLGARVVVRRTCSAGSS
jgi:hypothetical protein